MTRSITWSWILCGGICAALLAGCASQTKQRWLTLFFDGVPGSQTASGATGKPSLARTGARQIDDSNLPPVWADPPSLEVAAAAPQPSGSPMVVHRPYAERRCIECHASNFSQRLKGDVSGICTACHKGFLQKAKFIHAPVADGQCTICHEPHQGKEPHLLVKNVRDLCFDCHKPDAVFKTKACAESPTRACTECHDPHMEDGKFRLFPPGQNSPVRRMTPEK